jgi:hypothetical protein
VRLSYPSPVARGLDPRVHLFRKGMDCRVEPGNDRTMSQRYPETPHFGGSKPLLRQRSAISADVSAAMKARAAAGSVLLAGIAAAYAE